MKLKQPVESTHATKPASCLTPSAVKIFIPLTFFPVFIHPSFITTMSILHYYTHFSCLNCLKSENNLSLIVATKCVINHPNTFYLE